jgi:hypothetical protein
MQHSIGIHDSPAAANGEDHSTCLEAHGFLSQSYDSLDYLLRDLAHPDQAHAGSQAHSAGHDAGVELTLVGNHEWLMPFSHLFL